ncbi:Glutathione-dependent formaldehyde-activating enzyme [Paraburkholderia hiiakae]|uniref:Glutathione-dependent formaldehyde-activating enzyme n=1 Tax=Paraburkholderia hiiakae TaxID=1081782 RepID=A0ABM8P1A5_9BURK|nr:S-(hydroxymethyl)glutathione synthase [Paraburkholderia hiiakae]CAD6553026.1 Glutathione-dependent formaldehyde-activating enzyme [Paraburkholderia hiiakae]
MASAIHPTVDHGIQKGAENFAGGTLRCQCAQDPVEVRIDSQVLFNHACGCTQCWKPAGALFSVVGVVPRDKVTVTAHGEKLKVVDDKATILRHACTACGTHLYGRIEKKDHAFYGLDFIHTELSKDAGWDGPGFAAFVSSIIENGTPPSAMADVRQTLRDKGLEPYDCLSPALMDLLSAQAAKAKGTYREA